MYLNEGRRFAEVPLAWPIDGGVGDGTGLPNFVSLHAPDGSMIADLFDITGSERASLSKRLLAMTRMAPFRDRQAGKLSGGM